MTRHRFAMILIVIGLCTLAVYGVRNYIDGDWIDRNRVLKIVATGDDSEIDSFINDCGHIHPIRGMSTLPMRETWLYPIHLAAQRGRSHVLERFLDAGVDVDTRDVDHNSILYYLIDSTECNEHDRAKCLQVLMNYGLDVEQRLQNSELTRNGTALQIAASRGQKSLVEALLQIGADVSSIDGNGNTALHLAMLNCNSPEGIPHLATIEALLNAGANVSVVNKNDESPASLCGKVADTDLRNAILDLLTKSQNKPDRTIK